VSLAGAGRYGSNHERPPLWAVLVVVALLLLVIARGELGGGC
jgi:hypothetical protein